MSVSLAGKALLVALAALAGIMGVTAAADARNPVVTIEVRVWQDVNDERDIYISARPEGGSWGTLGTRALPLDAGFSSSGRFRYGDITVTVPLEGGVTTDVAVRVWQDVNDERDVYLSARPEGGSWRTMGTLPLPLDAGVSTSGRFRYGDARLGVLAPRGEPSWAQLPIPPVTIEFQGDFSAEDRTRLERWTRREYERRSRFFATRHGLTVSDLTIRLTRDRTAFYDQGVIELPVRSGFVEWDFQRDLSREYVHALQDELAALSYPTWIREGMGWYFEYLYEQASGNQRVTQRLATGQHVFDKARQELWWAARASTVPLDQMEYGSHLYVSFLAIERLVERSGEASLFDFYRRFAATPQEDDSWKVAFEGAFGLTAAAFYEEFAAWRAEAAPPQSFFTGVVLGPDGNPVEGSSASPWDDLPEFLKALFVTAIRSVPGGLGDVDWYTPSGIVKEDGTVRVEAHPSEITVLVVKFLPPQCGDIGFVAEDGSLTRDPDAARRFAIDLDGVSGIEIRLPRELDQLCRPGEAQWDALDATGWRERYR